MADIENPVLKEEQIDQNFLKAAELADAGEDIPASLVSDKPAAPAPVQAETQVEATDDKETDSAGNKRARDPITGKFIKTEAEIKAGATAPAKPDAAKPDSQAQVSEYEAKKAEKAKKEQERLDKTWENVNKRKEELEARRVELEQREQAMRQPQQQQRQPQQRQFSSRELFDAHKDFKARAKTALDAGDYDAFNENQALSEQSLEHAQQFAQIEAQEAQQLGWQKHQETWRGHMIETFKTDPDLSNPESSLSKELVDLLGTHGQIFQMIPDGFPKAVELAKLRMKANSADQLTKTNQKLQTEVDRLNGLTSISGSAPSPQPSPKKFEDMTSEEQEKHVLAAAQRIDAGQ